jgi:glycerol-3-phosphate dehydrogenase
MKRDLDNIANQNFDVLIIGGGIHGAAIARETALAGLKTALIEKKDFSHATSGNSLKIIHGGLRYLQHLDVRRMRESVKSRKEMMRVAPHLVKPLGCVMPLYGGRIRGKEVMRTALFLNDMISYDRNHSLDACQHLPPGKILSKEQCLRYVSGLDQHGLRGGCLWYDALAINTERLALSFIHEAVDQGACIANYLRAIDFIIYNGHITGVKAQDTITSEQCEIKAKVVVNAAGPWLEKNLQLSAIRYKNKQNYAKAVNIIVKKSLFNDHAVALEGKEKRFYFFVPWRGYTMIGTSYKPYRGDPDRFGIEIDDIKELVIKTNTLYPPANLTMEDVTFFHAGILPMKECSGKNEFGVQLEKSSQVVDHGQKNGIEGLISVKGVKYTTAPQTAKKVTKLILHRLNKAGKCNTFLNQQGYAAKDETVDQSDLYEWNGNDESAIVQHFKSIYGQQYNKILKYIVKDNSISWISEEPPLTVAEIIYFIREEMALKLSDIVFRRSNLGTAECPPLVILQNTADVMAEELSWDQNQKAEEIKDVITHYLPLNLN